MTEKQSKSKKSEARNNTQYLPKTRLSQNHTESESSHSEMLYAIVKISAMYFSKATGTP